MFLFKVTFKLGISQPIGHNFNLLLFLFFIIFSTHSHTSCWSSTLCAWEQ